jgi:toxin-antitoxin system PIN domain toxin
VILVDANLLIYAGLTTFAQHEATRTWFDHQLNGPTAVALPWPSLLAFLRVATNPRIVRQPTTISRAWEQISEWLGCKAVWIPEPTLRHREILGTLLGQPGTHSKLVPDAHLAALAIEHGLTLCSADTDFARFKGLRWENPLA